MPVPNSRFQELLQDIEPSPTTTNRAKGAHASIRNHLRTQAQFRARYVTSFLSGSYARDTSIRPQTLADGQERPDVDIIVVGDFNQYERPDLVLREVARALEDGGRGHPEFSVRPSGTDVSTMQSLVCDPEFRGSFAVLMIVRLVGDTLRAAAWVFSPDGSDHDVELELNDAR